MDAAGCFQAKLVVGLITARLLAATSGLDGRHRLVCKAVLTTCQEVVKPEKLRHKLETENVCLQSKSCASALSLKLREQLAIANYRQLCQSARNQGGFYQVVGECTVWGL